MPRGEKEYIYANLEQDINGQLLVKGSMVKLDAMKSIQDAKSYFQDMSEILTPTAFPFAGLDMRNDFSDDVYWRAFQGGMENNAGNSLIGNNSNELIAFAGPSKRDSISVRKDIERFNGRSGSAPTQSGEPIEITLDVNDMKHKHVNRRELIQTGWDDSVITDKMLDDLNEIMETYSIDTPLKKAHFLTQVTHESDYGRTRIEYDDGTNFQKYEGREDLGNIYPGDGSKFRGSGYLQLTGRVNAQGLANKYGDSKIVDIGYSYIAEHYAWQAAGFWWEKNNMNRLINNLAKRGDGYANQVLLVSSRVNGFDPDGAIPKSAHLDRREKIFQRAVEIFGDTN